MRLVELDMILPTAQRYGDGTPKYLLKRAVCGTIPDTIIGRSKQDFGVPTHEWSFGKLGNATRVNRDRFCDETTFLNKRGVTRLFDKGAGQRLWYLLNLALWWRANVAC